MGTERDFYVFREGRRRVPAEQLLGKLRASLGRAADESSWTDALLRAGELECAVEDAASPVAELLSRVTDDCAERLVREEFGRVSETHLPENLPGELTVSTPEGFAYYALHPMRYADVVGLLGITGQAIVIGIRSIGTTLSAVTAAALRRQSIRVQRFTVRPEGHPFDRKTRWNERQASVVGEGSRAGATFVIVDEGPGLSGSSFMSVAETLCEAVPAERVILVPAHSPDVARFRSRDAARRWGKFRCVPIGDGRRPQGEWMGGGRWRERFLKSAESWPGVWTSMERSKFLEPDREILWKFEGIGPYGEEPRRRAHALAEAGWGAPMMELQNGFTGYRLLEGANEAKLDADCVRQIAAYCAFRGKNFSCDVTPAQRDDLMTMMKVNFEREFQCPVPRALSKLDVVRPSVCDAKMAPHEWVKSGHGQLRKLDATTHGDDHFFPGPCDIAWDLAGAIVEWEMDESATALFLSEYGEASGDDAARRIDAYLLAYSVFRYAWSKTAADAMQGTDDERRLLKDYSRYRDYAQKVAGVSVTR